MAEDDRFYVKTLTLENFRCFERLELTELDPHFNLLIGENGSGKSSVLVALASLVPEFAHPEYRFRGTDMISDRDFRLTHHRGSGGVVSIEERPPLRIEASLSFRGSPIRASLLRERHSANEGFRPRILGEDRANSDAGPAISDTAFQAIAETPLALHAFYRTGRSFVRAATDSGGGNPGQILRRSAFVNWFDAGTAAESLREWVKNQTLAYYQREARKGDAAIANEQATPVQLLSLVSSAIRDALGNTVSFEFDADFDDIVIEFDSGERRDFSRMSDGQRTYIGLVADIARRACILNAAYLGNETLKETPGIVLIDEIDLHLHPKWQRQIVGALKRIFPKIQFFATTHSPQVIGEARPEEIVLLTKDGKQKRPMGSFGMDSNWILECVMEAEGRDPAVAKRIKALFALIEEGRFDEAKTLVGRLTEELPEVAPDIIAAEAYMWNLEHASDEAAE